MHTVAIFDTAGATGLPDLLDAAAGWCDFVVVNAGQRPWSDNERGMLEGEARFVEGSGLDGAAISRLLAEARVDSVLTFGDEMIPLVAEVASRLGLHYHSPETAAAVTRKDVQRRLLAEAGVQKMRHVAFHDAPTPEQIREIGFPAVLKPVHGNGSAHVYPVDDETELAEALERMRAEELSMPEQFGTPFGFDDGAPLQLEERLTGAPHPGAAWLGDYLSVETLTFGPGDHWHFWVLDRLPLTPPFRESGLLGPTQLPDDVRDAVCALTRAALDALGVTSGLSHTEIKLTPHGPRIIEVNGRLGGFVSSLLGRSAGADVTRLALEAAAGLAKRRPIEARSCTLALLVQPPTEAREVVRLADPAALSRLPGVWRVDVRAAPGTKVDYRAGTLGRVQTVWLEAATPEELHEVLLRVKSVLATENVYVREELADGGV
ncbi:ATP-grasp domain-containing protein [Streptomyces avermitilis]|uniref:ATP-grasp domain-containing protein n=1 Tax=Streptomyces avermitilis TaxID=33903 RepID=UPI0037F97577